MQRRFSSDGSSYDFSNKKSSLFYININLILDKIIDSQLDSQKNEPIFSLELSSIKDLIKFISFKIEIVFLAIEERIRLITQSNFTCVNRLLVILDIIQIIYKKRYELSINVNSSQVPSLLDSIFSVRHLSRVNNVTECDIITSKCGNIITIISSISPKICLEILWRHLSENIEESGWETGVWYQSEMLNYLVLTHKEISDLFVYIWGLFEKSGSKSGSIFKRNSSKNINLTKAEKSDKHSNLLIYLASGLRGCILRWISTYPNEYALMFASHISTDEDRLNSPGVNQYDNNSNVGEDNTLENNRKITLPFHVIRAILTRLESLATGTTKRLYLWPTLTILSCLLPFDFKKAVSNIQVCIYC